MFDKTLVFPMSPEAEVPTFNPEDFFDDCPICQAQKRALEAGRNLTHEEFVAAGREAERLGLGIFGTM